MGRAFGCGLAGSLLVLVCLATESRAQYFGRNKVQYDSDSIRVLATAHFDIYYSNEDAAAAQVASRMAERWYDRLSAVFDHTLSGRQPVVLYGSHRRFEQTNVHGGLIDESTGGFTDSRKRRIVLPFAGSLAETDHVLGHELVHAFQFDIADRYRTTLGVPLWFIEGMAEYLTLGRDDQQTAMWMRDAVASGRLPTIGQLASPRYFPYRWGTALWSYLAARYGDDLPARALRTKRDIKRRLKQLTGRSIEELTEEWHAALREQYGTASAARERDTPIISRASGGRLNIAASLSPDGRRMIFLSERDQFSIDLFLADAESGRIIRKLLSTSARTDFESLQYLYSAGSWDASGSQFAIATISRGRPSLLLFDVDRDAVPREIPVPQFDEIYSPTWSPDGERMAFSAMKGGVTDLFVMTLSSGALRQLTSDAYADLQPAWSPDGRTIAFTTDRFTTNLPRLTFGRYRVGLVDLETDAIEAAPGLEGANQLDPAWSPDGSSLYFVSDPDGISNVFRLERADGTIYRITDVDTGVTGVTRVSPALTVASQSGALAFGVFRASGYDVHRIADANRLAGVPFSPAEASASRSGTPADTSDIEPVPPLPSLASALPADQQQPYRSRLSLEGVGTPYFSAGTGPFGGYFAAGVSLLFGDLLGDRQLLTAVHVTNHLDESAFAAVYLNRASRWSWGLTVDQAPEIRLRTNSVRIDPDVERTMTRERDRLLWTNRRIGGFAAYPLNRSQRIEVSAGLRGITYSRERYTEVASTVSGMIVENRMQALPGEPSIGMAEVGAAFVGDTALFGATAPMLGSRYRIQATTSIGALKYSSVVADYRRYMMPFRPYTIAVRLFHSGRYGIDAGDFRLQDAYVGSQSLVRGYGATTVVRSECPRGSADCPALNSLIASRVAAAKIELRVPLWSTLTSSSRIRYGMVPLDAFVFADAGAGWGGEQRFGTGGVDGLVFRSFGAGVRLSMMGLIFEAAAVRPLDLARGRWAFGVNLIPGF